MEYKISKGRQSLAEREEGPERSRQKESQEDMQSLKQVHKFMGSYAVYLFVPADSIQLGTEK